MIRCAGMASPMAPSAARTRSRDSDTALSASPTRLKAGSPGASAHCTSTGLASTPRNATVWARVIMPLSGFEARELTGSLRQGRVRAVKVRLTVMRKG